jgi:hypothetical protein
MRKKLPTIVALVCIIIYVTAVLFAAYRVFISIRQQRQHAERELDGLQGFITQNGPEFLDAANQGRILERITGSKALEGLIITGSFGSELTFEREKGKVIETDGTSHRFAGGLGYTAMSARQIAVPEFRTVNLYALCNTIDYPYFIIVLRQTLLVILAGLILSFITFILEATLGNRFEPEREEKVREEASPAAEPSGEWQIPEEDSAADDDAAVEDPMAGFSENGDQEEDEIDDSFFDNLEKDNPEKEEDTGGLDADTGGQAEEELPGENFNWEENDDEDGDFENFDFNDFTGSEDNKAESVSQTPLEDTFNLDDFLDEEDLELPSGIEPGVPPEEPAAAEVSASGPKGLYSPHGDIGWEEYTKDRLASELHRCAASEQDLAVLLLECGKEVDCTEKLYNKLAGEAVQFFNLKDLTFVKGERGISVIIPNADLEHGIRKAEEFHARIIGAFPESFASKGDLRIGLSSRSGRLIDADRLLFEASTALAKGNPSAPIVAFKSNPEKYRDFVRKGSPPG